MFFSSPSADLKIIIILLVIALGISVITYIFSKKILLSIFLFSAIGNIVLYGNLNYNYAKIYDILWVFKFSRNIWPYLNLALLIFMFIIFVKNRYASRNKK